MNGAPDAGIADEWRLVEPSVQFSRTDGAICTATVTMPAWSVVTLVLE